MLSTQLELSKLQGHLTAKLSDSILAEKTTLEKVIKPHKTNIDWLTSMLKQALSEAVYEVTALAVIMRHLESLTASILKNLNTEINESKN